MAKRLPVRSVAERLLAAQDRASKRKARLAAGESVAPKRLKKHKHKTGKHHAKVTQQPTKHKVAKDRRTIYALYLQTDAWKVIARQVMARDNNQCQWCLSKGKTKRAAAVHHTTYKHIFHERLDELVAVCKSCHEAHHGVK